jgi:hypothetical protein
MKKYTLLLVVFAISLASYAQDSMEKVMEKRAREMHRVLQESDKEQWKKFIKENYTQALIDKPMRAQVSTSDNGEKSSTTKTESGDKLEAKAGMFRMLHNDFGDSDIVSIKPAGEKLDMVLKSKDGMRGTFSFKFEPKSPYLIDAIGIEVGGDVQR